LKLQNKLQMKSATWWLHPRAVFKLKNLNYHMRLLRLSLQNLFTIYFYTSSIYINYINQHTMYPNF